MDSADSAEVGEVTRVLNEWNSGDPEALDRLMPVVVNKLRDLARLHMRRCGYGVGDTIQPTEIVSEAYLKLRQARPNSEGMKKSEHFYALSAEIIKHILIDYIRRKRAARRGGGVMNIPLDETINLSWIRDGGQSSAEDLLTFQEVLERFETGFKRESQVLSLKHYVGLADKEIATLLGLSVPTVQRDLTFARAWIRREVDKMASQIFDEARKLQDAGERRDYLAQACAGNESLLKDVELLLKKEGSAARDRAKGVRP